MEAERLSWVEYKDAMKWKQGDHITLLGTTGSGKTEAELSLIEDHPYKILLTTKKKDKTLSEKALKGFKKISNPEELQPEIYRNYLFRTKWGSGDWRTEILPEQSQSVRELLLSAFDQGGWTISVDELPYITKPRMLGLGPEMELLWLQGRSEGVTVVCNTQRPRSVPLEAYSQATHLLLWNTPDAYDLLRLADLVSFDREAVMSQLPRLAKHDILAINTDTHEIFRTNTRW